MLRELCKDPWDAEFIDNIEPDRQLLYDVILVCVLSGHNYLNTSINVLTYCGMFIFVAVIVAIAGCQLHGRETSTASGVCKGVYHK